MADGDDYEVGYGRPPKATRFKKGEPSRNPSGRPKRQPSFLEQVNQELNVKVEIHEGGRRRRVAKRQLLAKQIVNGAIKGDKASWRLVQPLLLALDAEMARAAPLSSKEQQALDDALIQQVLASLSAPDKEADE